MVHQRFNQSRSIPIQDNDGQSSPSSDILLHKALSNVNEAEEMVEVEDEVPSQCYSEGSGKIQESQALSPQSPQQPRRVSCEEAPVKNFELRRCRSEVARPRSSTCAECAAAAASSPVNGAAALLLGVPEQNALTAIDKIQAFARTARELRTMKLHYYPEGGWGWVILFCASVSQCVTYGLTLAAGTLLANLGRRHGASSDMANIRNPSVSSNNFILGRYRFALSPISGVNHIPARTPTPLAGALAAVSLCVASLLSPVIVAWCRRKSTRLTAVFGGLVAALGLLFTSFASQFHQLFLSYGLILGIGVGLTRDTATLMVGQYFKRRREAVEIALVGSSGIGLAVMTAFLHSTLTVIGWRLGLQSITGLVVVTFFLGSCYRSASLYHPQRRAILHLKNQRKKIKEKNKQEDKPPFFDLNSLKSRTIQSIMVSSAMIATGLYTPLIYLSSERQRKEDRECATWQQVYMGLAWALGCATIGLLIVRQPSECRIGRQYLCQAAGLLTGLALLSQAVMVSPLSSSSPSQPVPSHGDQTSSSNCGLFSWIYGFGLGAYHYALKMFVYQRVRARNFTRAWSFVQASQAIPLLCGIPLAGYLSSEYGSGASYYFSSAFVLSGSLLLFTIDVRKYVLSHWHFHRHEHHRRPPPDGILRPRTPAVASEHNTDGSAPGEVSELEGEEQEEYEQDVCPPSCKARVRRDSLAEEENQIPPLTLLQQTSLVLAQLGELPCAGAAELTCISEEGIADMDIPDHLLEELDFAADCITSCDKVENYLMLSEYENNLIGQTAGNHETIERKVRNTNKPSIFRKLGQTMSIRRHQQSTNSNRMRTSSTNQSLKSVAQRSNLVQLNETEAENQV